MGSILARAQFIWWRPRLMTNDDACCAPLARSGTATRFGCWLAGVPFILPSTEDRSVVAYSARYWYRIPLAPRKPSVAGLLRYGLQRLQHFAGGVLWGGTRQCGAWSSAGCHWLFL